MFQYQRLPFGISLHQHCFLQGLTKVCVYIDDILIAGVYEEDHLHNLGQLLEQFESAGLSLKRSKCVFMTKSVEYLGRVIDASGLHPLSSNLKAIKEATEHTNITEFQTGWTISDPGPDIRPYFQCHTELSIIDGCILWGSRMIISVEGRRNIVKQLDETHPGVSKMKSLAHSCVLIAWFRL